MLANIDEVGGKKRKQNLREFGDQARLSLELVTLKDDCESTSTSKTLRRSARPISTALSDLFSELEFDSRSERSRSG